MKKTFLFILLIAGIAAQAQLRKIPAEVTEAFKNKYPQATNVEWKDKLSAFAANFDDGSAKYEARFNKKGEWLQSEHASTEADLPAAVKDGLSKSKYADWKVSAVYTRDLPGDKTQYRINVEKGDLQKKILLFSKEGQLLKDNMTL
jgi:hypothetical protein